MMKNAATQFANATREEKLQLLEEVHPEAKAEMAEVRQKLAIVTKFCRDMGLAEDKAWAMTTLSIAEAMGLDLDDAGHLGAAAMLADFQLTAN